MKRWLAMSVLLGVGSCATAGGSDSGLNAISQGPPSSGEEAPLIGWLEARGERHRLSVDEVSAQRGIFETYDEMNAQEIDASLHLDSATPSLPAHRSSPSP